ncbi:hypothetical protein [Streptomyces buecherae]|uniref:hypothetical protein n=1 Tax=Streptomyces buecherae TaxID=2763006 RepID=UPI0037A9E02C
MSAMGALEIDAADLDQDASSAAQLGSARERLAALGRVFESAGEAAHRYADPDRAALELVRLVAHAYREAREEKEGQSCLT